MVPTQASCERVDILKLPTVEADGPTTVVEIPNAVIRTAYANGLTLQVEFTPGGEFVACRYVSLSRSAVAGSTGIAR